MVAVRPTLRRNIYALWRTTAARRPAINATVSALREAAAPAGLAGTPGYSENMLRTGWTWQESNRAKLMTGSPHLTARTAATYNGPATRTPRGPSSPGAP